MALAQNIPAVPHGSAPERDIFISKGKGGNLFSEDLFSHKLHQWRIMLYILRITVIKA